ncbi:MAG: DNA circularization N-terminal domain-containing protein, partial [Natronospirillum sp.]
WVERSDTTGGRRWLIHEYPRRDKPYAEDMGRAKREWRLQLFVAGEDYDLERDRLIKAVDAPGAATLVHPYLGTVRAVAMEPRWNESTRDGGICTFQITFVEAGGEALPVVQVDTQRRAVTRAAAARQAVEADFIERYNVVDLAADRVATIEKDLTDMLQALEQAVGDVTGPAADVIRSPVNLAGTILGAFNRIESVATEPARALTLYSNLFNAGGAPRTAANSDPEQRRIQVAGQNALRDLIRLGAVIQACESAAGWTYQASDDALGTMDTLTEGLDAQVEQATPLNNTVYNTLSDMRSAVVEDLRTRGAVLPRLSSYTPQLTLPALVIAHQVYGDARRDQELIERNKIRHPGAIPGGTVLEVLSE